MIKNIRIALLMVVSLFAVCANAAPLAYSVNSDSVDGDSLYRIDLATGVDQLRGKLFNGIENRTDTEGLAFTPGPDSILWGVDDDSGSLFPISTINGSISFDEEIQLPIELQVGGKNDFGMTFSCDNSLFFTSVKNQALYRRDPDGSIKVIGTDKPLGVNISAIAAIGNPTRLYGLGNGRLDNGNTDSPNLYRIDVTTGTSTLIGPLGSPGEFQYDQAGMDFDSNGDLWAITDRSLNNLKSQILKINVNTGAATLIATTVNEVGFESLAIGPPADCNNIGMGEVGPSVIPTLNLAGRLSAILILLLAGAVILRRRNI